MRELNPTLWRTCRVLSGHTRLKLLRLLHDTPGQSVSALGAAVGIGVSAASQELRRIQSRGLLKPYRRASFLIYRLEPDPQVPSAAPLLQALHAAFSSRPPEQDPDMIPIATGLSHPRRIQLVRLLITSPLSFSDLRVAAGIPVCPLSHHLAVLRAGNWIHGNKNLWTFRPPGHPLAHALVQWIQSP
jgi:DNA-binding transcriptional ArsR family regulator